MPRLRRREFPSLQGRLALAATLLALLSSVGSCSRAEGRSPLASEGEGRGPGPAIATQLGELALLDPFPLWSLTWTAPWETERVFEENAGSASHPSMRSLAYGCTCVAAPAADGTRLLLRNFDWYRHPILALFLKPANGYASISLVDIAYLGYGGEVSPADAPSFLESAPRIPFDGMNEKGLAIGMMAIDRAEGPATPTSPTVGELGLIRLLLDRAADVEEALALARAVRVSFDDPPIHYLLADASGDAAVLEFLGGSIEVHRPRTRGSYLVSTNFLLSDVREADRPAACVRYRAVLDYFASSGGVVPSRFGFDLLEAASQASTIWSCSYDLLQRSLTLVVDRRWSAPFCLELR
jgi:choloylglycine hydrolase